MDYQKFENIRDSFPFLPLNEVVYKFLFEEIITLNMMPGEKLNEAQLAKSMDVSRSPIQVAIKQLCEEGLVEKSKGKTSRVSSVEYEDCMRLSEARIGIEGEAAFHSAKRITASELKELKILIMQMEEATNIGEYQKIPYLDHQFHEIIIKSSQNLYIINSYDRIKNKILRYRWCVSFTEKTVNEALKVNNRHKAIYYSLKNHISDQARQEVADDCRAMAHFIRFL